MAPAAAKPADHPGSIRTDYIPTTVVAVRPETHDTSTLRLATDDPAILAGRPGQFVMVGVPAFAIPPISISRFHPDGLELTIRAAGAGDELPDPAAARRASSASAARWAAAGRSRPRTAATS